MRDTKSIKIVTSYDIDPRNMCVWAVKAIWFGRWQTVYTGSIFGCLQHVRVEGWKYDDRSA